jgi:hypothetical protein
MTSLIVRLYASAKAAQDVARQLKAAGFADSAITLVTAKPPAPEGTEATEPARLPDRERFGALGDFYAERLASGRSLVAVKAEFGEGAAATRILEAGKPVDREVPKVEKREEASYSDGTPLSRALGMNVLSGEAAPLSKALGWATSTAKRHFLAGELSSEAAPLSRSIGLPTLTERRHFLVKELTDSPAPLSSGVGMRVLSDEAAPLSTKLGLGLLKNDPTPLSSRLGLRVLTEKQ